MFKNLDKVNMTYVSHMCLSLHLSFKFGKACICAIIHAFIPDLFETHSTDTIYYLHNLF